MEQEDEQRVGADVAEHARRVVAGGHLERDHAQPPLQHPPVGVEENLEWLREGSSRRCFGRDNAQPSLQHPAVGVREGLQAATFDLRNCQTG